MIVYGFSIRKVLVALLCFWTITLLFLLLSTPNSHDAVLCSEKDSKSLTPKTNSNPFPKELSFILLNWKRLEYLKTIVKNAQQYSSFVTEIVVGNNNPDIVLSPEDFDSPSIPVKVFNFPQNQYFVARYEICMMANGKYCYMQDDDWNNKFITTLYANFLRSPHLLHTNTNAYVHYLSWVWTFYEPKVNLHSGFSWLGTGAIASKDTVRRFLLDQSLLIQRQDVFLADMYFASWFNQVPYQLQNELHELDTTNTGFSNEEGGITRNKIHIAKGVRTLYEQLASHSPLFPTEEFRPTVEERYIKSSCFNDECLFMTSAHSFPSPRQVKYEPRMELDEVQQLHFAVHNHEEFVNNPYNFAVDEDIHTAWISLLEIKKGDFFGLDLLEPLERDVIYLIVKHEYQEDLEVEVSLDGETWSTVCDWKAEKKKSAKEEGVIFYRYTMTSSCTCSFRFIRFKTYKRYSKPLHVYDIAFSDKAGTWN